MAERSSMVASKSKGRKPSKTGVTVGADGKGVPKRSSGLSMKLVDWIMPRVVEYIDTHDTQGSEAAERCKSKSLAAFDDDDELSDPNHACHNGRFESLIALFEGLPPEDRAKQEKAELQKRVKQFWRNLWNNCDRPSGAVMLYRNRKGAETVAGEVAVGEDVANLDRSRTSVQLWAIDNADAVDRELDNELTVQYGDDDEQKQRNRMKQRQLVSKRLFENVPESARMEYEERAESEKEARSASAHTPEVIIQKRARWEDDVSKNMEAIRTGKLGICAATVLIAYYNESTGTVESFQASVESTKLRNKQWDKYPSFETAVKEVAERKSKGETQGNQEGSKELASSQQPCTPASNNADKTPPRGDDATETGPPHTQNDAATPPPIQKESSFQEDTEEQTVASPKDDSSDSETEDINLHTPRRLRRKQIVVDDSDVEDCEVVTAAPPAKDDARGENEEDLLRDEAPGRSPGKEGPNDGEEEEQGRGRSDNHGHVRNSVEDMATEDIAERLEEVDAQEELGEMRRAAARRPSLGRKAKEKQAASSNDRPADESGPKASDEDRGAQTGTGRRVARSKVATAISAGDANGAPATDAASRKRRTTSEDALPEPASKKARQKAQAKATAAAQPIRASTRNKKDSPSLAPLPPRRSTRRR